MASSVGDEIKQELDEGREGQREQWKSGQGETNRGGRRNEQGRRENGRRQEGWGGVGAVETGEERGELESV